jgi:ABC-type nickel/cobalt efflux system permease component RcnA
MLPNLRENVVGLTGSTLSWLAVITGNQQQLEYYLRVASLAGALIVSVLTAWSLVRKLRRSRAEQHEAESP